MQMRKLKLGMVVTAAAAVLATSGTAGAVGTAASTPVDNMAVVNYSVGGVPQALIESSPAGNSTPGAGAGAVTRFVVDNMVDLTVVEVGASYTSVAPGATARVLTFTLTNTGNNTQDFSLTQVGQAGGAGPFGGTDNFDAAPVSIFVDGNGNGAYDAGVDTATYVDELAADTAISVFIVADVPAAQVDGDLSVHTLVAQVAQGGGVGVQGADILADDGGIADDPLTVQIVFADGAGSGDAANDGQHSERDGYVVASAQLTITKASTVISDPVNLGVNPKAIPGAIVEYTITIANSALAGAPATGITVSDDLSVPIAAGSILFEADTFGVGNGIEVTAPNIGGGAATALSNALDPDEGDFGGTAADAVTVTGIDLNAGESATVRYRVEVQ